MKNKTIVITGATGGIGKELTKYFMKKEYKVIAIGRNKLKLKELKSTYKNLICLEANIKNPKSVRKAFEKIDNIDFLINNASVFIMKNFTSFSIDEIDNIIDTNLKGTIYCTLEALKKIKNGRIINISSVSGTHGIEKQTIYSASKFGIMGFADSLAQETNKKGILISTICPGGVNTSLWNPNNPYPGDVNQLLSTNDVVSTVEYIINLPKNVVLKTLNMFPKCEWH